MFAFLGSLVPKHVEPPLPVALPEPDVDAVVDGPAWIPPAALVRDESADVQVVSHEAIVPAAPVADDRSNDDGDGEDGDDADVCQQQRLAEERLAERVAQQRAREVEHLEERRRREERRRASDPSFTWPATLLRQSEPVAYGEDARRKLIATVVELSDPALASALLDALYEEGPDGLRPDALAALREAYHGEQMRAVYRSFARIGNEREREIARNGLAALDASR